MLPYQTTELVRISKNLVPYKKETFTKFISPLVEDFENAKQMMQTMINEIELTVFDGMDNDQMIDTIILTACQNIQEDIDYDKLATRVLALRMYHSSLQIRNSDKDFESVYIRSFKEYIHEGIALKLLNPELVEKFDLDELGSYLEPSRDDVYMYIGMDTAHKRYMIRDRDDFKVMETPQFMWMRIAMGISLEEQNPTEWAKRFYDLYSNLLASPGGSTNIGAGTTFSVLSNCYLLDTEDDIHSIFDNVKNVAMISKATGGIGISVTKLRASGSPVRSNNTQSTGPIPFVKVMDTTLKSMARAGKKHGAMAVYMENWHIDFPDFLDLRQNAGDDYRRIRTANTAVYISDEFMKRVVNGEDWFMFDPLETPELTELYGSEFSEKYEHYVNLAKRNEMRMVKQVPARELMKRMVATLVGTSHPWFTWKDTINLRALNNNTGTIHTSNLCTEICLPQDRENIAVCNLAYLNIAEHIREEGDTPDDRVDWIKLEESTRILLRHLDNLVEVNESPLKETANSDENNRAVGMGMSGFTDALEQVGLAYDSPEAYDFVDKLWEFVSYISIDESCNLADERGVYNNFEGSMWSKGYVPIDTVSKVAADREGTKWTEKVAGNELTAKSSESSPLNQIKEQIEQGLENARSSDSKELYELFGQLTTLLEAQTGSPSVQPSVEIKKRIPVNAKTEGTGLFQDTTVRMDWNALRERVKEGMRNATTMAIAPNASTGLLLGTTPGIDPRFANIFSRATSRGKFLDINHNLVMELKKLGIWEDVKGAVLENYGDISSIDEIPENLKEIYKTSFQISPYAFIEVASRAQKWIDQAISRNMYLATRDIDEIVDIYTEAWRRGLKTTYYLHTKPRHTSEQSTVKVNKSQKLNKKGFGTQSIPSPKPKKEQEVMTVGASGNSHGFGFSSAAKGSGTTTQMSLDGKEKKGFGFAAQKASEKSDEQIGFANVASRLDTPAELEQSNLKAEPAKKTEAATETKFKPLVDACPVDPMERANCEACQ